MKPERVSTLFFIKSWIVVCLVSLCVAVLPFRCLLSIVKRFGSERSANGLVSWETVRTIVRSVKALTNHLPDACLIRAAAVSVLLGLVGIHNIFRIGTRIDSNGKLCGHAWVTVSELVIIGGAESTVNFREVRPAIGNSK